MIRRGWLAAAMLAVAMVAPRGPAFAQSVIEIRNAGSGVGPAIVARALATPHDVVERGTTPRLIRRDSAFSRAVVAIQRTVVVEGTVHGDLIAIGSDVYLHPGGQVDGRVIAIGGAVYESMLAHTGSVVTFHDFTYDVETTRAGYALSYRVIPIDDAPVLPSIDLYGLRIPTYDRMNGLSLAIAPSLSLAGDKVVVEPRLTYRSNLGRLDPGISVKVPAGGESAVTASIERTTPTNETWIWSDLVNSVEYLLLGHDARNFYRATRGEIRFAHPVITERGSVAPFLSARWERSTSIERDLTVTGAPWTFRGRHSADDASRPNPAIDAGTIVSAVAGAHATWSDGHVNAAGYAAGEIGTAVRGDSGLPVCVNGGECTPSGFGQLTLDGRVSFPTFGTQSFSVDAHAVATWANRSPRQRWAYLGGPGTIPTLGLLELGGDELVYADFRYTIPLPKLTLPLVGAPNVVIREVLGGAGIGAFPAIHQAIGGRVALKFLYVEFLVDPVSHRTTQIMGIAVGR